MIIKTGIDIIEVKRIEESIKKFDTVFLNKIFTKNEIEYCESKKNQKYQSYAVRFAGKEAVLKAISDFLQNKFNVEWKDIEIINNLNGRPFVKLNEKLLDKIAEHMNKEIKINFDISFSHIKEMAIASVVVYIE